MIFNNNIFLRTILEKDNLALNLYLGSLREPWLNHCKKLNEKPGHLLKKFVQDQLKEIVTPLNQTNESSDEAIKQRFTVLLTPSEKAAIEVCARQDDLATKSYTDRRETTLVE